MRRLVVAILAFSSTGALAQHQPYSGQEERELKALSSEEVKQYLSGAGMGYAKVAELNRFPGPMHVLELSDRLDLTPAQVESTKQLMVAHKAEARRIGERRIASERAIEALFRSGMVDELALANRVREAAMLEGEYRLAHLDTHRRMRDALTEEQIRRYDQLRGYSGLGEHHRQH